jgi:hypothetical protein
VLLGVSFPSSLGIVARVVKARTERMMRKIKPATVKIVAQALSDIQGKFKLGCFGKSLPQAVQRQVARKSHTPSGQVGF